MKRFLYLIAVIAFSTGINGCKSDDPAPVSPIVGRWELNRGKLTGFVAPYQELNTVGIDLYNYDFGSFASRIDIRADNSFTDNIRQEGLVADANGTWEYTNTQLTLKYDDGSTDTYNYTSANGIEELTGPSQNITFPVSATASAPGQLQIVYRK